MIVESASGHNKGKLTSYPIPEIAELFYHINNNQTNDTSIGNTYSERPSVFKNRTYENAMYKLVLFWFNVIIGFLNVSKYVLKILDS